MIDLTTFGVSVSSSMAIAIALSAWLGKIWRERIARDEKVLLDMKLAEFKNYIEQESQKSLRQLQSDLDILRERQQRGFSDKLEIYRLVTNIVSDALADIDLASRNTETIPLEAYERFNRSRLKAYGYLAMLAPQVVMDGFDSLVDHIFDILEGRQHHNWAEIRRRSLDLIVAIRSDIGIDTSTIQYKGNR